MYVYPNGQTYNEMVNDPCFVRIPGCTRDTGQPLSFQDRAVGQTLRGWRDKTDGAVEWHNQNIEFTKEGLSWSAYERGTVKQEPPNSSPRSNRGPDTHLMQPVHGSGLVTSGNPGGDDGDESDSLSDSSFDEFRLSKGKRSRTPWLRDGGDPDPSSSSSSSESDRGHSRQVEPNDKRRSKEDQCRRKEKKRRTVKLACKLANSGTKGSTNSSAI
ncbi:hypothetical protein GYMLUDRAFT_62672 [Collybiopsis luxurians FD-317 M1]|uniref:Uncharacterized protein n=1 Tax=Collybiopsis luxurians FD-317 M1 TaxID=944289 RepID=A0A0D0CB12_9AGAR|nr:hypothetical protein GYMLUDRAFT_62672 [Collybiopsis luxurians FD-317 M1]